jgi:hypothetical protein
VLLGGPPREVVVGRPAADEVDELAGDLVRTALAHLARRPVVDASDVANQLAHVPLGTRRHACVEAGGGRGGEERATLAVDGLDVLVDVHGRTVCAIVRA